jgi:hypothetical protein
MDALMVTEAVSMTEETTEVVDEVGQNGGCPVVRIDE